MVMSRGRRNKIIIISISVVILIILVICIFLYFTTDMFKSNDVLFAKYIQSAAQNIEGLLKDEQGEAYNNSLRNNKYTSKTEITADYTQGMQTTAENKDNVINQLKFVINGKVDEQNGIDYKDFILQKEDQKVSEMEYLKSGDKYGLRFTDLFGKYLAVENQNLKEVASKLNMNTNIPDRIEQIDWQGMAFTDEEINAMNETYSQVMLEKFDKTKFTSLKETDVTVGNNTFTTNAYTLNLTKEELNNIYISILEQMKQDEQILNRIDTIDKFLNPEGMVEEDQQNEQTQEEITSQNETQQERENQNGNQEEKDNQDENQEENMTEREKYIKKIDDTITEIKNKNIGVDDAKISVYENSGITVKTTISTSEYTITLDTITNDENKKYVRIFKEKYGEIGENSDEIIIEKQQDNLYINRTERKGENTYKTNFTSQRVIENGKQELNLKLGYDTETNKIEINLLDKKEIVNGFDQIDEIDNRNSIILNTLSDEDFGELRDILNDKGIEQLNAVSEQVNIDEVFRILNELEILPEQITISNVVNLTTSEVSRFNAELELYKGQEVDVTAIDKLLGVIQNNLDTFEVLSNTTIKLNIVRGTVNTELANKVSEIVNNDENKSKKYQVEYEYDENTKIITAVIIQILQDN